MSAWRLSLAISRGLVTSVPSSGAGLRDGQMNGRRAVCAGGIPSLLLARYLDRSAELVKSGKCGTVFNRDVGRTGMILPRDKRYRPCPLRTFFAHCR